MRPLQFWRSVFTHSGPKADGHTRSQGGGSRHVVECASSLLKAVGLFDESAGVLFSGDLIYVGGLVDNLPCSNQALYRQTMQRFIDLQVQCIHGGHGAAMSSEQMKAIARQYLHGTSAKATL